MADFTQDSKFNKEANFGLVRFGADAPLLETELNELQDIQSEARADIVRESIHSGFTKLGALTFGDVANTFTLGESVAFVNGYRINIPEGTAITLSEPPTEDFISATGKKGYREDLVFLEVWKEEVDSTSKISKYGGEGQEELVNTLKDSRLGIETSKRVQLKWRIRTVEDINFDYYSEGLSKLNSEYNLAVIPQGGRASLPTLDEIKAMPTYSNILFRWLGHSTISSQAGLQLDSGLHVSGSIATKDLTRGFLNTVDGYVYAIPMFKVSRRNSGKYSSSNGNGGTGIVASRFEDLGNKTFNAYDMYDVLIGNYPLRELPNGIKDEVINGKLYKRVSDVYTLKSSDITSLYTSTTNINVARVPRSTFLGYKYPDTALGIQVGSLKVSNLTEYDIYPSTWDDIAYIGGFSVRSASGFIDFIFSKDTTLAQAQALLGGLEITYQLAQEQVNPSLEVDSSLERVTFSAVSILDRDVIDLRHKVSLTGFNYQQLLEENFDKLLRGELQTKERVKTKKTYFGIPKTSIDVNTIFYVSFDGTTIPELGNNIEEKLLVDNWDVSPTGLGVLVTNGKRDRHEIILPEVFTVDMFVKTSDFFKASKNASTLFMLSSLDFSKTLYGISMETNSKNTLRVSNGGGSYQLITLDSIPSTLFTHIRMIVGTEDIKLMLNGKVVLTTPKVATYTGDAILWIGYFSDWGYTGVISDFSISNIDRGDVFTSLPQDFIDGYADIAPAFNNQRSSYADPLTSQTTYAKIMANGVGTSKGISVSQATKGSWKSGDKIVVKGLTGEMISGVIDSDTALTKVISYADGATNHLNTSDSAKLLVQDSSKLSIGDVINLTKLTSSLSWSKIISAINGNVITLTNTASSTEIDGYYIVEIMASSSSPVVKYNDGTTVAGTWSGLGTDVATFTVSETTPVSKNIDIQYSLNMIGGQGKVPVYTEVLQGEYDGQILIPSAEIKILDDFKGKVSGSTVVCPHISKRDYYPTLKAPTLFSSEQTKTHYDSIMDVDGNIFPLSSSKNGDVAQVLFSFDLVRIVEDKFGEIPATNKVQWLKDNISKITCTWHGYGSSPSGNSATISVWSRNSDWQWGANNTGNTVVTIKHDYGTIDEKVSVDGFVHYIVRAKASDGVTPSTISTDYLSIEVELKGKSGYTALVPENNRRDAGKSGILLVRPETREVERYQLGDGSNERGIKVWGNYVPYQREFNVSYSSLFAPSDIYLTTLGTGRVQSGIQVGVGSLIDVIGKVTGGLESSSSYDLHSIGNTNSQFVPGSIVKYKLTALHATNSKLLYLDKNITLELLKLGRLILGITPHLCIIKDCLYLYIRYRNSKAEQCITMGFGAGDGVYFKLQGSPLVKEVF